MPAAIVPMVIDQGEDFTAQIIWSDDQGQAMNVIDPIRLDIKGAGGITVLSLTTPETVLPPGEIPEVSYSAEIGMIQLHIPRAQTAALTAGSYIYDIFVSVDDGDAYAGVQQMRILAGSVVVNQRVTVM